nr:hypothetical protein [Tanacetum cinerariifolium]
MSTPTFAETHNLVAFLEKPAESAGFEQIIDFLISKPIDYALTVNPTIYVSCVKQFWATAKVNKVNDKDQIQALVDKTKVIITEDSIRSDLRLDDAEGTACLLNEEIFEGLACMGRIGAGFFGIITPLFDTMMVQALADMDDIPVETHQTPIVLDLQEAKDAQAKEIAALKKKVSKLNKWRKSRSKGLRRLKRFSSGRRMKSPMEKDEIALDDETQGRTNDNEMFGVDDLAGEEVVMDSVAEPVTTVKDSPSPTTDVTEDEITMAQALAALKSVKSKVVVQEQEMSTTIPAAATIADDSRCHSATEFVPGSSFSTKALQNGTCFYGAITPLFETMMVQAPEEVGKVPTDTQDTPIITQPSSSQPQRKHTSRRMQRKETEVSQNEPPTEEHIPKPSHDPLPSEQIKTNQAGEIEKLKKRVKKFEGKKKKRTHRLKRLYKVGLSARIISSDEEDVLAGEKEEQTEKVAEKKVSTADPVTTAGEVVTTADVEVSAALSTTTTKDDELTLAQTLVEIKAAKPNALTTAVTTVAAVSTRPDMC